MKDNKELTRLISAMVLGDGHLGKHKLGVNARYTLSQLASHEDYVKWQAGILENLTSVSIRLITASVDLDGTKHQDKFYLQTHVHPFYTTIYERTYFDGRKSVS